MQDYLLKAATLNSSIRIYIARTTDIVKEAQTIHETSVTATAALGRLLTAASLMGSMLKDESELLTLTIRGEGPLKGVVATSDCTANVKGYVFNPKAEVPLKDNGKIDVSTSLGTGTLSIIKDTGLKEPYVGQVDLVSGEIAEDLTYYYAQSEQIPTSVALGVLIGKDLSVKEAGGFIIQLLPGADESLIDTLEYNIKNMKPFTMLLDEGKSLEEILKLIVGDFDLVINEEMEMFYFCNCSKKRVEKALISIGRKELKKIISEDKKATLHCHFCGKDYNFSENELIHLLNGLKQFK